MIKSIEALLRGYLLFRIEGKYYLFYSVAFSHKPANDEYSFDGWHILKGWRCFSTRWNIDRWYANAKEM